MLQNKDVEDGKFKVITKKIQLPSRITFTLSLKSNINAVESTRSLLCKKNAEKEILLLFHYSRVEQNENSYQRVTFNDN